jgi:hypothetical protein
MAVIPQPIVNLFGGLQRQDYAAARACLADTFSFVAWFDTFDSADAYIESLKRLRGYTARFDMRHAFVDGDDVALFYDLTTVHGDTTLVVSWFGMDGDRIARIRVVCDPRPFMALWGRS